MTAQDGENTMESPRETTGYESSAHLYDLFDQKPNFEFFYHYAAQAGEILDIGAGTGRIALPLAEGDVRVTCIEPSPAMRLRPDLAARIRLFAADARSFDAGRTFPAAFLSGTFDHFLDDEERRSSLVNIARHLVPDGLLVFDVFLGLMVDSPLAPAGRATKGDREVRRLVGGRILPNNTMETHHDAGRRSPDSGRDGFRRTARMEQLRVRSIQGRGSAAHCGDGEAPLKGGRSPAPEVTAQATPLPTGEEVSHGKADSGGILRFAPVQAPEAV
jgi:SAM-dependent methyltransferase